MIGAVVLAAGAATRYGGPKQRVFLPRVLERLRAAPVDEIVVVAGAYELETDARVVPSAEATHADVVLADGPRLDPRAVARVLDHRHEAAAVAASYGGVRGHPVCLARATWSLVPDEGARALETHLVSCDDLDPPGDVDYADAG